LARLDTGTRDRLAGKYRAALAVLDQGQSS
jgi:hypothetical protein